MKLWQKCFQDEFLKNQKKIFANNPTIPVHILHAFIQNNDMEERIRNKWRSFAKDGKCTYISCIDCPFNGGCNDINHKTLKRILNGEVK